MSLGIVILTVAVILVLFGVGHRVLDRLRLNDKVALLLMIAIIGFSFVPDIPLGGGWSVNVGGALIPFGLVVYLWIKAGSTWEKIRSIIAGIISAGVVIATNMLLPAEPEALSIDPYIIYGVLAGLTAYLFGRSRRGAFMAGIMGVLVADIARGIINGARGIPVTVQLGRRRGGRRGGALRVYRTAAGRRRRGTAGKDPGRHPAQGHGVRRWRIQAGGPGTGPKSGVTGMSRKAYAFGRLLFTLLLGILLSMPAVPAGGRLVRRKRGVLPAHGRRRLAVDQPGADGL